MIIGTYIEKVGTSFVQVVVFKDPITTESNKYFLTELDKKWEIL